MGSFDSITGCKNLPDDSKVNKPNGSSEQVDHSRSLALITKSMTPSKKVKSLVLRKSEDDLELILDSESELEEQACADQEIANVRAVGKPWEDHAVKEFTLVLSRTYENERTAKLNAKVEISAEYPLRPPLFTLSLLSDGLQGFEWYKEPQAMEAEVNLHIIKVLPLEHENYILAHQICCLSMLFDFHFDACHENRKSASVIDAGLCKPVSGTILARSVRGRDRRKMISWKGMGCTPGYPC